MDTPHFSSEQFSVVGGPQLRSLSLPSHSAGSHFAPRLDKSVMTLRPLQMGQNNFTFLAAQISTLIVMMVSEDRREWRVNVIIVKRLEPAARQTSRFFRAGKAAL